MNTVIKEAQERFENEDLVILTDKTPEKVEGGYWVDARVYVYDCDLDSPHAHELINHSDPENHHG